MATGAMVPLNMCTSIVGRSELEHAVLDYLLDENLTTPLSASCADDFNVQEKSGGKEVSKPRTITTTETFPALSLRSSRPCGGWAPQQQEMPETLKVLTTPSSASRADKFQVQEEHAVNEVSETSTLTTRETFTTLSLRSSRPCGGWAPQQQQELHNLVALDTMD